MLINKISLSNLNKFSKFKKNSPPTNEKPVSKETKYMPKSSELGVFVPMQGISDLNLFQLKNDEIDKDVFFIRMSGYGRDFVWAEKMKQLVLDVSKQIKNDEDFDLIIKNIESGVSTINKNPLFARKRYNSRGFFTFGLNDRGMEYYGDYKEKLFNLFKIDDYGQKYNMFQPKQPERFKHANTCKISSDDYIHIVYGYTNSQQSNMRYVKEVYSELKQLKNPSVDEILEKIATIRWLLSQESGYFRGSESITTVFERALLHSFNIENIKYKKQVSPDFEVFYRNLDEFVKVYPKLFEKKPEFINK